MEVEIPSDKLATEVASEPPGLKETQSSGRQKAGGRQKTDQSNCQQQQQQQQLQRFASTSPPNRAQTHL